MVALLANTLAAAQALAAITLRRLQGLALSVEVLPAIHDIDEPADLLLFRWLKPQT
jgi:glycosyltransferase A (GT-A) superfamily protein (DUF2064 family)